MVDEGKLRIVLDNLKDVARKGEEKGYVFYEEAGGWVDLDMNNIADRNELAEIFGTISEREYKDGRPCLSVIVVLKNTHMPSYGFIPWMTKLGIYSGSRDPKKQNKFIFDEMRNVWAYWQKH